MGTNPIHRSHKLLCPNHSGGALMTQHEKKFLITGLTLGLMLALVAYAAMRLWHPERSAAQSQETPIPKYETTSDQSISQSAEHEPAQTGGSVSSIQLNQKEQT